MWHKPLFSLILCSVVSKLNAQIIYYTHHMVRKSLFWNWVYYAFIWLSSLFCCFQLIAQFISHTSYGLKILILILGFPLFICTAAILLYDLGKIMADMPGYFRMCFYTGRLACLAMLVSTGIVLQILVRPIVLWYPMNYRTFSVSHCKWSWFAFLILCCRHVLCTITGGQCWQVR